jgi:hypothetical protein
MLYFGDTCIRDLERVQMHSGCCKAVAQEGTDHNVDGTIALERELEEGHLVIPVDHVAFDGRGLSTGKKGLTRFLGPL